MATRKAKVTISDFSGQVLADDEIVTVFVIIGDTVRRFDGTQEEVENMLPKPDIRTWARNNGFRVASKGKISEEVKKAFVEATK